MIRERLFTREGERSLLHAAAKYGQVSVPLATPEPPPRDNVHQSPAVSVTHSRRPTTIRYARGVPVLGGAPTRRHSARPAPCPAELTFHMSAGVDRAWVTYCSLTR